MGIVQQGKVDIGPLMKFARAGLSLGPGKKT
jgi:hypothetical protein